MDIPISYNFGIFTQGVLGVLGCAPIIYWDIPLYWRKGDIAFCTIHLILLNVATHFLCVCILNTHNNDILQIFNNAWYSKCKHMNLDV